MKLAPIIFVFIASVCTAQTGPPPPAPPPPPGLPIDNYVLFFLLLGLIYGVKKIFQLNKSY